MIDNPVFWFCVGWTASCILNVLSKKRDIKKIHEQIEYELKSLKIAMINEYLVNGRLSKKNCFFCAHNKKGMKFVSSPKEIKLEVFCERHDKKIGFKNDCQECAVQFEEVF